MIKLSGFFVLLTFLCFYSFKDWYKSLCGLIVLLSIIEHPDVPKSLLGITGLSPWNILFIFVLLGWMAKRKQENLSWDMPKHITLLLIIFLSICIVSFFRLLNDTTGLIEWSVLFTGYNNITTKGLVSEHIINTIKWVVPGILLFHGCNNYNRLKWGIFSLLLVYIILALLVIKAMPLGAITSGDRLQKLALKLLISNVGYHRVNLAMMLSGAFWALYSIKDHVVNVKHKKYILFFSFIIFYALALTGGRTGYLTWGIIGTLFSIMLWRRLLIYGPILILTIVTLLPAARERFEMGFDESTADTKTETMYESGLVTGDEDIDLYTVTSGRTIAWPYVIEKIKERPMLGYGKEAMLRAGVAQHLYDIYGERFPHPHNLYLQWIFDNGIILFIPVLILFYLLIKYSLSLLLDKSVREYQMIGGISLSLILAFLIAGFGSQTFYPREGSVPMWAAIFLMLRVFVQRAKLSKYSIDHKEDSKKEIDIWGSFR